MIYISGDTHGELGLKKLNAYFNKRYVSSKDYLIILGDAGIIWDQDYEELLLKYSFLGLTIFFIDGNHENFDLLNKFPVVSESPTNWKICILKTEIVRMEINKLWEN